MKAINQNSAIVFLAKGHCKDTELFHPLHFKATGVGNWYEHDLEYFEPPSFPVTSIPNQIRLEKCHCNRARILGDFVLTFINQEGYLKALSSIHKTIFPDWYYGCLKTYAERITYSDLVLVQFSPDRSIFRVYLFEQHYPEKNRTSIVNRLIQEICTVVKPTKEYLSCILRDAMNCDNNSSTRL